MGLQGVKITLPPVRFSYLHAYEPKVDNKGKESFGAMLIIDKADKKTIKLINQAIEDAKAEGATLLGRGKIKTTFYDGDIERPEDPACEDAMYLNTSSNRKIAVFNSKVIEITDYDKIYSGMYGRASVTFKAYKNDDGGKGIACYINGIQKTKDGERLDGFTDPSKAFEDDFNDFETSEEDENDFTPQRPAPSRKKASGWDDI